MSKLERLIQKFCSNGVGYKSIGEISSFRRGSFPQPYGNKEWYDGIGAMPFVQVADIGENMQLVDDTKRKISALAQKKSVFAPKGSIIISLQGSIGRVAITQYDAYIDRTVAIFDNLSDEIFPKYFAYQLQRIFSIKEKSARGSTIKTITKEEFTSFEFPIPPLEIQREIARILDNFTELTDELTDELTARRQQYEYYRNTLLKPGNQREASEEFITLGDIGKVSMCKRIMKTETSTQGEIPFYKIGTFGGAADAFISKETYEKYRKAYSYPKKGDILISAAGTIGREVIFDGRPSYFQDSNIVWLENNESRVLNKYLYYYYQLQPWRASTGGTITRLYNSDISRAKIYAPSIERQKQIVGILDQFDIICNDLSAGLPAEIEARQKQYEYYRDKLLTFKEKAI